MSFGVVLSHAFQEGTHRATHAGAFGGLLGALPGVRDVRLRSHA
ncbi:MAG: hypothetical protein ABI064_07785 [Acidobacteriaceae bacterium]